MSRRSPIDRITVEAVGVGRSSAMSFEDWTSMRVRNSLTEPSEAAFELGDETGDQRMLELAGIGAQFRVYVNDRPRLKGRVEMLDTACDAQKSATQSFVIRTRLTDAIVASAPQGIALKNLSIKQFVLAVYEGIGLKEQDFDFRGDTSRNLMTGKPSRSRGDAPPGLEPLKEEQAKVQPPETVFEAVDRHLRRHGFLHWDGPDGRIIVARPNDQQDPFASLWMYADASSGHFNNLLSLQRTQDVGNAPTVLGMFGVAGKVDFSKTKVASVLQNDDLIRRGFDRRAIVIDEGVRTKAIAERRAKREFAERKRGLDRLEAVVDGLSYLEGVQGYPWAPDTVVDVVATKFGGAIGAYYVEAAESTLNANDGNRTALSLVAQGVWVL